MLWQIVKRLRRRGLTPRRRYGRLGVTGLFAAAALVVILIAGWLLDRGGSNADDARLVELARGAADDPVRAIADAARSNRIVFLSDIHASPAAKRLAARAIERIVATSGLDVLALEVGADQQPVIDQYLERPSEDAAILLTNGRSIREPGPATRDYLDIYRTVWKLNQKLGADRRIQVVAADLPGWPPARPLPPAEAARKAGQREAHMQKRIQDVINMNPGARVLVFMTGFHGLKRAGGQVQTGGTSLVEIAWLADRLEQTAPEEVYSFLVDAPTAGSSSGLANYVGTTLAGMLQRNGVNKTFVTPLTAEFDVVRQPLVIRKAPGASFDLTPRDYKLRDVADAYIYLR